MGGDRQNISEKTFGSLGGCLIEGDPEQRACERRVRRRALATSVALQGAALAALVPLFGKSERIAFAYVTPVPPYCHPRSPTQPNIPAEQSQPITTFNFCVNCPVPSPHPHSTTIVDDHTQPPGEFPPGYGPNSICTDCIPMPSREGPTPPQTVTDARPGRLKMTRIDSALLIHRVEPVYPALPRQMGRGGRVELRAIIAIDGTIQFLQVVSGDPLLIKSALDAVRQWRYRPTILNGQPMEIDTFITVIYNINR